MEVKEADVVLTTILTGSIDVWRRRIEIPKTVDINVSNTHGPSGIFRFLRRPCSMLEIVRDMEKHCPNAILLVHNPMAMLCGVTGLCHSVQGIQVTVGSEPQIPPLSYVCAGINHHFWYYEYEVNGQDAYILCFKAMAEGIVYNEEASPNKIYLALGYYVTKIERA